ncbi:MAG: GtrA family protein [Cyanobacteria bacterium P01_H01_bin.15]
MTDFSLGNNLVIPALQSSDSAQSSKISLSLVLPTFNESENIEKIIIQLTALLDERLPGRYELIVVDDDSPDQTWAIAAALELKFSQLQVLRRQHARGLSSAVIRGWQVARGGVLGVIDADLQHPPETLIGLWEGIEAGADLSTASRHVSSGGVSDWSFLRRFLSRGAQMLGLIVLPEVLGRLSDPMSGFFLVRRSVIADKKLNPVGYKILIEVVGRGRIKHIHEVGYVFQERFAGKSNVTWRQYWEYIQHLFTLRLALWAQSRLIRFCLVGGSGVFVDLGVFYVAREILGLALTRSAVLSAEVAIISNFILNDIWTFGDYSRRQTGWRKRFKRFIKFNLISLTGMILNVLILNILFNLFGMNEYLAKIIAIIVVAFWNYWFNLKLNWRVTEV